MIIARCPDDTLRAVRLNATGLGAGDGTEGGKNQREQVEPETRRNPAATRRRGGEATTRLVSM
jgi:hypothetical protein